jgi:transcriptional regulator with XRE-family HTH domain
MTTYQQITRVRTRKLGLLIMDARTARNKTVEQCAKAAGIAAEEYHRMETGEIAPTLPQLESIAFYLDIPLEHFWGTQTLASAEPDEPVEQSWQLKKIRQRIIAARIKMARQSFNLSPAELAQKSSIPEDKIIQFESGEEPIPLPDLEILTNTLQIRSEELFDQHGPIGNWRAEKLAVKSFMDLPQELREFICKPINLPYLQIAKKLSELPVEKLRAIAEGLLEITY